MEVAITPNFLFPLQSPSLVLSPWARKGDGCVPILRYEHEKDVGIFTCPQRIIMRKEAIILLCFLFCLSFFIVLSYYFCWSFLLWSRKGTTMSTSLISTTEGGRLRKPSGMIMIMVRKQVAIPSHSLERRWVEGVIMPYLEWKTVQKWRWHK